MQTNKQTNKRKQMQINTNKRKQTKANVNKQTTDNKQ